MKLKQDMVLFKQNQKERPLAVTDSYSREEHSTTWEYHLGKITWAAQDNDSYTKGRTTDDKEDHEMLQDTQKQRQNEQRKTLIMLT